MSNSIKTREEQVSIREKELHIPQKYRYTHAPRLLTILLSILLLIVLLHFITVWLMPGASVSPTTCSGLIRTTDYTQLVHLQSQSQEMQAVQFVTQLTDGQPSALVQVTSSNDQHTIDAYIYGCTIQNKGPKLTPWFTQRGLVQGSVSVSQGNTLITSELDTTLSAPANTMIDPLQQNIYREYAWHNGAFVQIAFPALYPVTNRSEAELLQQQANNGQSLPWNDPFVTAEQMAKDVLKWPTNDPKDKVLSNDGTTAQVLLVQQKPHFEVTVTLKQLLPHNNNAGIWFVVSAQTPGITLNQLTALSQGMSLQLSSPLVIQGTGAVPSGQTTIVIFDHTLTPLSILNSTVLSVDANGAYTGTLLYTNNVSNQPGLLLIQSLPTDGSSKTGQLLLVGTIVA